MAVPGRSDESPLDRAVALVREGRGEAAVALLEDAVTNARAAFGKGSSAHTRALSDLGSVLSFLGEDERAIAAFEEATAAPQQDPEAEKQRLTALLNLAEVLERQGHLIDAEDAARRSLQARREVYGPSHPGYAFALEPLAHVLLRRGKLEAAQEAAQEAIANFLHHQHPRLSSALALRAEIDAACGADPLAFAGDLDEAALLEVAARVLERVEDADPRHARPLLLSLTQVLEDRAGLAHETTLDALTRFANLEAAGGDVALREAALERLRNGREARGEQQAALEAEVGLALVSVERRDREQAEARFVKARARAEVIGTREALALVERAEGYLARAGAPKATDPALVQKAAAALEARVLARAPTGLVQRLEVGFDDEEGLSVGVDLLREPSDAEKAALERAVEEARREVFRLLVDGRL